MHPRTKRQREILDYIESFIEIRGYKPSYQQIARHFHIRSKSAIAKHIAALESQGLLSRYGEHGNFNLQLRGRDHPEEAVCKIAWLEMPFRDVLPETYENDAIYVPKFLLGNLAPEDVRVFRVRNNSMINEHICQGDIAIIENRSYARDGDITLVLIQKQFIELRKIFRKGANLELHSGDAAHQIFETQADNIEIQGILRGVLRPVGQS